MKKLFLTLLIISFISCKDTKKETVIEHSEAHLNTVNNAYPENLQNVFEAHGGLDSWKTQRFLEFTMLKEEGDEVTRTNLRTRASHIETPDHAIGFNGKDVWLLNKGDKAYTGKPKFYYNLMFYFYAMPFVLADEGIVFKDAEPLVFEGERYPGIHISYQSGIGGSPEDEYILYYNAETYKMEWLAYTVTFFTNEKAKELHFRRYNNWQDVDGLLLPKTIVKYKYENNLPTTENGETVFAHIKLSKEQPNDVLFEIPEGAEIIE
ncbi:DUF6503 family protein [Mariniflexile ostreae]|uniref:DUF6503 family protein n=1 Tax=Mariniflexile ostreae TaxID=1520892 RepID=A0ABV5F8E6_9FLAO